MSTNRVLLHLDSGWRQRCLQQKLDRLMAEAERIELAAGDELLEFIIPPASTYLDREDDDRGVVFMLGIEPRRASHDESLVQYAVDELRRIGAALLDAADQIESGVSP